MKDKASIYVPAIGKVTIVILLRNLLVSIYLSDDGRADLRPEACGEQGGKTSKREWGAGSVHTNELKEEQKN